jgi:hypothetical protein
MRVLAPLRLVVRDRRKYLLRGGHTAGARTTVSIVESVLLMKCACFGRSL